MNKLKVTSDMWLNYNSEDNTWTVKMRDENGVQKITTVENLRELDL